MVILEIPSITGMLDQLNINIPTGFELFEILDVLGMKTP